MINKSVKSENRPVHGPFGEGIRHTISTGGGNPFRFSTKYQDDTTDLIYFGHRYYTPNAGRWLQRDPIGENGGNNVYVLVNNQAPNKIDINGLIPSWPPSESEYWRLSCPICFCIKVEYDNGTIQGSGVFGHGESYSVGSTYNNVTHDIACINGPDTPGFDVTFPAGVGFTLNYVVNFNWTGTVTCQGTDGHMESGSASINQSFTGSGGWHP